MGLFFSDIGLIFKLPSHVNLQADVPGMGSSFINDLDIGLGQRTLQASNIICLVTLFT